MAKPNRTGELLEEPRIARRLARVEKECLVKTLLDASQAVLGGQPRSERRSDPLGGADSGLMERTECDWLGGLRLGRDGFERIWRVARSRGGSTSGARATFSSTEVRKNG